MEGFDGRGMRSNITIREINTDDLGMYSCGSETFAGEYYRRLRVTEDGVAVIAHERKYMPRRINFTVHEY